MRLRSARCGTRRVGYGVLGSPARGAARPPARSVRLMDVKRRGVGWFGGFEARGGSVPTRGRIPHRSRILIGRELFWPCRRRRSNDQRTEQEQEQELWRELQANVAAVAACYPSAEALQEEAAEAERLAGGCTCFLFFTFRSTFSIYIIPQRKGEAPPLGLAPRERRAANQSRILFVPSPYSMYPCPYRYEQSKSKPAPPASRLRQLTADRFSVGGAKPQRRKRFQAV